MGDLQVIDEEFIRQLPLPLAQLYRRAHNAKTPLERHQAAYYLWEAALKLLGSVAVVEYAELNDHDEQLAERLKNLSRPSVGHWWEFVRRLVPVLADSGDAAFAAIRDLVLGRARDHLSQAVALDRALCEVLEQEGAARGTVRLSEMFDRLVRYRNREMGHGAAGQRPNEFYERMGRAIQAGVAELLGHLDVLAGRRLIYVAEVRRQASGNWLVERYELIGQAAKRIESLELTNPAPASIPRPERLYLATEHGRVLRLLHPLLMYDVGTDEVFYLSARRGQRRTDFLCYGTGRVVDREELGTDQREMLARMLGGPVAVQTAEAWAARSQAEEPTEPLPERGPARRSIGEFELLSRLGRGGMGVVYRAWQSSLGRQVALKCLVRMGDAKAEGRFAREIHALGRVEHPSLVKVFSCGMDQDQWFYTMELVEGADLASVWEQLAGNKASELGETDWLRAVSTAYDEARKDEESLTDGSEPSGAPRTPAQPVTPALAHRAEAVPSTTRLPRAGQGHIVQVVEIVRQVAEACHALHEAGVVHRDIKPGNIMLTPDGSRAVLMDLGLAQLADEADGRLTRTRQFVGTLRYASPEQVLAAGRVDRRSDVYSLGVTLWELLTLRPMFGATDQTPTPDLMLQIQSKDPDRPRRLNPRVPVDLEAIVLKCLEKDRSRRYSTAADLAADLARWQRGEPVSAQPPTLRYLLGKYVRRNRLRIATAASLLLAVVSFTALAFFRIDMARREAQQRLILQYVARGVQLTEDRDLAGSLAWFAAAFERGPRNLGWRATHRIRLASAMQNCVKPMRLWTHDSGVSHAEFCSEGCHVLVVSGNAARVLDVATGEATTPPLQHDAVVRASFGPDGRHVVTASFDRTARVWDAATGKPVTPPLKHNAEVLHAAFSPDGKIVVTASGDGTVRVWDATRGVEVRGPLEHTRSVSRIEFSRDGRRVVTASGQYGREGEARVWDLEKDEPLTASLKHSDVVDWASFSRDGRLVVTASADGRARVWDARTGELVTQFEHPNRVVHASFSPDGLSLATSCDDDTARLWDLSRSDRPRALLKHKNSVLTALFSDDGLRVVTASADGTARVWDAATGELLVAPLRHNNNVQHAEFSHDGRFVLTASLDGTARIWDLATAEPEYTALPHEAHVTYTTFSHDGRRLVTTSGDGTAVLWDAATGKRLVTLRHEGWVIYAEFAPDDRSLVTTSTDRTARVWDCETGEPISSPLPHDDIVSHATYSPDGRVLATSTGDRYSGTASEVRFWDVGASTPRETTLKHNAAVLHVAFSRDGRRVLTASYDNTARVWDANTAEPVTPPLMHTGGLWHASFSPDGCRVVTASLDFTARVWDATTGAPLTGPLRHTLWVTHAAFSPDGSRVVTASYDRTAQVWNARTGQRVTLPLSHDGIVWQADFSPDGRFVLTASEDHTARVWDAETGEPVTPPLRHRGTVLSAAFSPDGRRVATASSDQTARLWPIEPAARSLRDEELMRMAQLLSGQKIDNAGGFVVPLSVAELRSAWQGLQSGSFLIASPEQVLAWHERASIDAETQGKWLAEIAHLEHLIEARPTQWHLLARRARAHAELGEWHKAAADYEKAIELGAAEKDVWYERALVGLAAGATADYRDACRQAWQRLGATKDPEDVLTVAWASVLLPDPSIDLKHVVEVLEKVTPGPGYRYAYLVTRGAALYRQSQFETALDRLGEAAALDPHEPAALFLMAMAQHRLGLAEQSRRTLARAVRLIEPAVVQTASDGNEGASNTAQPFLGSTASRQRVPWTDRLELQLLRSEAELLVQGRGKTDPR